MKIISECEICPTGYDQDSCEGKMFSPACSQICFMLWASRSHRGEACWISAEVFCSRNDDCIGCPVYKTEMVVRNRGLNKEELWGEY